MKKIFRSYRDTEILALLVRIKCPVCGYEWMEDNVDECGKTYHLACYECDEEFEMYFDAD